LAYYLLDLTPAMQEMFTPILFFFYIRPRFCIMHNYHIATTSVGLRDNLIVLAVISITGIGFV